MKEDLRSRMDDARELWLEAKGCESDFAHSAWEAYQEAFWTWRSALVGESVAQGERYGPFAEERG